MTRLPPLVLLLSVLIMSCGPALSASSCPDGGTTLTWSSFGHGFMTSYCAGCHSGGRLALTSQAQVQASAGTVDSMVQSGSMPPRGAPSPTSAERANLDQWLSCGAP